MERVKKYIHDQILAEADMLSVIITNQQNMRYPELIEHEEELKTFRKELICLFAESILLTDEERIPRVKEWATNAGSSFSRKGYGSLDMFMREVPHYRNTIGTLIKYEVTEKNFSAADLYDILTMLDSTIHDYLYFFTVPYVAYEKEVISLSKELVAELSVPLVSITDDIAVLPLIGTMDLERSNVLYERVLRESYEKKIRTLIVDLSGLHTTDTFVAQQLYHLFDAVSLLGIQPVVSGVTPMIAQTLGHLGLTFGKVPSYSSLKIALREIQRFDSNK